MNASSKTGLSMIEVMIGVILLALIIVPSLNVIMSQTQTVAGTREHTQAALLAQKIQEIARSYRFDLISMQQYNDDPDKQQKTFEWRVNNTDELKKHVINNIEYTIENLNIEPAENMYESEQIPVLYMISFDINYTGSNGKEHRLNIATAISKRE